MIRRWIVSMLMCATATVAQADVTFLFGDKYIEAEVPVVDVGPAQFGVMGAVDYFAAQSQPLKNFHLDTNDHYSGLFVKVNLEGLYVAYKPQIKNSTVNDLLHVLEAGVTVDLTKNIGIGIAYQYCADKEKDDKLLLVAPFKF